MGHFLLGFITCFVIIIISAIIYGSWRLDVEKQARKKKTIENFKKKQEGFLKEAKRVKKIKKKVSEKSKA